MMSLGLGSGSARYLVGVLAAVGAALVSLSSTLAAANSTTRGTSAPRTAALAHLVAAGHGRSS
jgi:hypothetical protein